MHFCLYVGSFSVWYTQFMLNYVLLTPTVYKVTGTFLISFISVSCSRLSAWHVLPFHKESGCHIQCSVFLSFYLTFVLPSVCLWYTSGALVNVYWCFLFLKDLFCHVLLILCHACFLCSFEVSSSCWLSDIGVCRDKTGCRPAAQLPFSWRLSSELYPWRSHTETERRGT